MKEQIEIRSKLGCYFCYAHEQSIDEEQHSLPLYVWGRSPPIKEYLTKHLLSLVFSVINRKGAILVVLNASPPLRCYWHGISFEYETLVPGLRAAADMWDQVQGICIHIFFAGCDVPYICDIQSYYMAVRPNKVAGNMANQIIFLCMWRGQSRIMKCCINNLLHLSFCRLISNNLHASPHIFVVSCISSMIINRIYPASRQARCCLLHLNVMIFARCHRVAVPFNGLYAEKPPVKCVSTVGMWHLGLL